MRTKGAARSRRDTWVYVGGWLIIALLVFGVIETAGYVFLARQRAQHGPLFHFDIDAYVAGIDLGALRVRKRAAELRHIWAPDPRLGWRRTPSSTRTFEETGTTINTDSQGARAIPNAVGPISIASYGDSFTEGLEVDDADTWQAQIAYATGTRVLNFGVSAYGPDQALLALEANLEDGIESPIVILAMINENLNRMMNSFRLFYTYPVEDVPLGFKPIFVRTASGFVAKIHAPADITDVDALRRAIWAASEDDWFYPRRTERISFPFSLHAAAFLARNGLEPESPWPDYSAGLARDRLEHILRRFHADSLKYGFTPVFVLLPESGDELRSRGGNEHPVFSSVVGQVNLPGLIYIDVTKALTDESADPDRVGLTPDSYIRVSHPSVVGNRAIADAILERLRGRLGALASPPAARSHRSARREFDPAHFDGAAGTADWGSMSAIAR